MLLGLGCVQTYTAFAHSPPTPPSSGRLSKSRNSSHTRLVAPSPLSQSHSADEVGSRPHDNVVPGVPISLDDPVTNPPSSFTTNSSTSSLLTVQPSSRALPESPLKSLTAPDTPNISTIPRKPPPVEPARNTSDPPPSVPAQIESESPNDTKASAMNQQKPTLVGQSMPSMHTRKRSASASASPSSRDNGSGGFFRSRRASNQAPTSASTLSSSQPPPTSISGPSQLKPPTTKPPVSGLGRNASTDKREKRGSILGRLVKKFSVSRKFDTPADSIGSKSYQPALRDSPIPEDSTVPTHSAHLAASAPATMTSAPTLPTDIRPGVSHNLQSLVQKEIEIAQASDIRDDLPHHIPTPRVFSPLILHAPIPPGSPSPADSHRIGSLMIANPDILPTRTPSPTKFDLPSPQLPTPAPHPDRPTLTSPAPISSPLPIRPPPASILNAGAAEQLPEHRESLDRRTSYERHSTVQTISGREPPPFPVLSTVSVQVEPEEREPASDPELGAEPTPRQSREPRESRTGTEGARERGVISPPSRPPSSSLLPPPRPPQQRESISVSTASGAVPNQSVSGTHRETPPTSRRRGSSSPTKESSSGREDAHKHRNGHHRNEWEREHRVEHQGDRDVDQRKMGDQGQSSKSALGNEKDRDHTRDRERRHHRDREHRRHRDYEGENDREGTRKRRSKDRHRGDSSSRARQSSEDRERRRHGEVSSDSTPPLTIHPPVEKRSTESSRGPPIFPQASPVATANGSTPPLDSHTSPSRRRRPSTETIQALGKEWEIVPDDSVSQRRVSRSREGRRSADRIEAASPAVPSSSGSLASGIVQKSRSIVRMRRSLSADSSLTSRSRQAPTPPPKGQPTKPPTSGSHPLSARRQSTTPPRGKSPSPQPSRPIISGPTPIGSSRSRKNSASSTHLRSSPSKPQATQSIKPSSSGKPARPGPQETNTSSSAPRSHPKSLSTEDLPVTRRRGERATTAAEVSETDSRRRRGQSWSIAQAPAVLQYPPPQSYPPVPTSHTDGLANSTTGHPSYRPEPDATGPRVGSSHTSFNMQAPIRALSIGKNQLPSSQQVSSSAVSEFYGRAAQQFQPATQIHSPYSNPHRPSSGYDPRTGFSASSAQPNALPPGYPASSSLTNLSQAALVSSSEGPTLVHFSNRAPYPIAAYGQQRSSSSWGSYASPA